MVHSVSGVRLAGVAAAVPARVHNEQTLAVNFDPGEVAKLAASTGIRRRHVAGALCASDLCEAAARDLLSGLGWSAADVAGLIVVTQTPDHFLPATACLLHGKLGLRKEAIAFDLSLGCSGYVYGLWVTMTLMASAGIQRALLLVGDTVSRLASPRDRSTAPLFGDAGTATALELSADVPPVCFCLGTDGTGAAHLVVPAGGFRSRPTAQTREPVAREGGNVRSDEDLYMNGAEIFAFSIREVPPLIDALLAASKWPQETVDCFVLHQANEFMLRFLARKMRLPEDKMPLSLAEYGNTSSASIPLTLATALRERLEQGPLRLALAGFGVGLSWGAATLTCGPMVVPRVRLVAEPEAAS